MGLEYRNGKPYYYMKQREGKRVRSIYMGAGRFALGLAALEERYQVAAHERRLAQRAERDQFADVDRVLDELETLLRAAVYAVLKANGYHQHKGQWRKRRERTNNPGGTECEGRASALG
jgi:hypothetical protein